MIEQEITRLVNQSEKKGRFIIQELEDDNAVERSQTHPNNVEKYFGKRTKHSSICNNNKIIHLLHNQSENTNLNANFSTYIFEDRSKNWVDFDIIWRKFSKFHCDLSENKMEKIFNYTDLKLDDQSSYFNDSYQMNNKAQSSNILFSNENCNKKLIPSIGNLTNIQTTHDVSHSNIAESGLFNTTAQVKNVNNETTSNQNLNNMIENHQIIFNKSCNKNPLNIENSKNLGLKISSENNTSKITKNTEANNVIYSEEFNFDKLNTIKNMNERTSSPLRHKNLEINFCEKRIIESPPFSPINSDYCDKFEKENSKINEEDNQCKIKSSEKLLLFDEYFKSENTRQKRIFSEFKHNCRYKNANENSNFTSEIKISKEIELNLIPEVQNTKLNNKESQKIQKKKIKNIKKKKFELKIVQNNQFEISNDNYINLKFFEDQHKIEHIPNDINQNDKEKKDSICKFCKKNLL